jgi:uncharacterized Zn finger protein
MKVKIEAVVVCPSCGKDPKPEQLNRLAVEATLQCGHCGSLTAVQRWVKRIVTAVPG